MFLAPILSSTLYFFCSTCTQNVWHAVAFLEACIGMFGQSLMDAVRLRSCTTQDFTAHDKMISIMRLAFNCYPRSKGNFATPEVASDVALAVQDSGSRLIMVLGHTQCSAIDVAVDRWLEKKSLAWPWPSRTSRKGTCFRLHIDRPQLLFPVACGAGPC